MKIFYIIVILLFSVGCSRHERSNWYDNNGKVKILTTTAMINDIVMQVGGDNVDTISLIQGELDPHSYELVKGDDEKFAMADIIFYNGLGLEHGVSLRQMLEHNPKAVSVADPILAEDAHLILKVDGQYDPHVWMDIALWMRTVKTITASLIHADPQHRQEYQQRADALLVRMQIADENAYRIMQSIPASKRYLVTSHDAFNYFARHYLAEPAEIEGQDWYKRFDAPEGLAPDAQLSLTDIQNIITHIKKYRIHVVFPESNVSKDSLRKIVDASLEHGINLHISPEVLYGDSMGGKGTNANTYLDMIEHNVNVIAKELSK